MCPSVWEMILLEVEKKSKTLSNDIFTDDAGMQVTSSYYNKQSIIPICNIYANKTLILTQRA